MSEELHQKILAFLSGAFGQSGHRMCVKLELSHAQQGFRDEPIKTWDREEDPELFADLGRIEALTSQIVEKAFQEADSFGRGTHRFVLRTFQHLGGREKLSFSCRASYADDGDDETALALSGGSALDETGGKSAGGALGAMLTVLSQQMRHNEMHMRDKREMYQGSIGMLARMNNELRDECSALRKENAELRRTMRDAEDNRDERDLRMMQQIEKDKRKDKALGKLLTLAPAAASRLLGTDKVPGTPTPLSILIGELAASLSPVQMQRIASSLAPEQTVLLMEAIRITKQQQEAQQSTEKKSDGDAKQEAATPNKAG